MTGKKKHTGKNASNEEDLSIFITVGSTKFDELCSAALDPDFCEAAAMRGFTRILLQIGSSNVDGAIEQLRKAPNVCALEDPERFELRLPDLRAGVTVETFRFKSAPELERDVEAAALVISHAGAGSILSALSAQKPLLVVVNDSLMDNHQLELARQLDSDGFLKCTTPAALLDTFRLDPISVASYAPSGGRVQPWPPGDSSAFVRILQDIVSR